MATIIPQRELRNDVGAVLRRVEAGEEFVVTVSGRPVAELRAVRSTPTGSVAAFVAGLAARPSPSPEVVSELERLDAEIREMRFDGVDDDPWRSR